MATTKRHSSECIRFRSETYLRWVRAQPCVMCGAPADDAHHAIGLHDDLSGMALTASDLFALPVCRYHHTLIHNHAGLQHWQPRWLIETLERAQWQFTGDLQQHITNALTQLEEQHAGDD